jgi:hypothetical protein
MAQTTAIVDKLLTQASAAYRPEGFISELLFPTIKVKENSGKLGKYTNQHLRITNTLMGGEAKARRVKTIVRADTSYYIENHGLEDVVSQDDYDNVERPFDAEKDVVMGLNSVMYLGKEYSLAETLSDTAIMTSNVTLSGSGQLSDYSNSDPIAVFDTARNAVRDGCGMPPNVAWMDWKVAQKLKYHPALLESLGHIQNRKGKLTDDELAAALDVERLYIARVSYDSAVEGQSDSFGAVWGKHMWFACMPKVAAPYQKSLGYYITKIGRSPRKVYKYAVNNPPGAKAVLCQDQYDYLLADVNAGYLIKDAIA